MALKLTMTCGLYDRSQPLIDGRVKARDIDLDIHVNSDDRSRQRDGREEKSTLSNFSPASTWPIWSIEPWGSRQSRFLSNACFVTRILHQQARGDSLSEGSQRQTSGLADLVHDNRIVGARHLGRRIRRRLRSITWVANWGEKVGNWQPPPWLKLEIAPAGAKLHDLLIEGKIDAGITTETWAPFGHPEIDFLIPNFAEEERNYFTRTGFFPIQHTLLIKNAVLEKYPWVAMSMFDAWQEAKQECYRWLIDNACI